MSYKLVTIPCIYIHYLWRQVTRGGILGDVPSLQYFRRCLDLDGRDGQRLGEGVSGLASGTVDKGRLTQLCWRGKEGVFLLAQVLQNIPKHIIFI